VAIVELRCVSTQNSIPAPPRATRPGILISGEMFARLVQLRPALFSLAICGVATLILFLGVTAAIRLPERIADYSATAALVTTFVLIAALGLVPVVHLLRYAETIRKAEAMRSSASIEAVLRRQLRLWRFIGVASIVWAFVLFLGVLKVVMEMID
jgi:hypothetical protein